MSEGASWHAKFKHSAYVFAGGLPFDLTEGDILAVFSQYGEIVDVNLVRAEDTGKSRGFAFVCYEDQRSTVLAVDNLNGAKVVGRTIKVDHVEDYKLKDEDAAKRKDWKCGCGGENFKFRDNCFKCGGPRPLPEQQQDEADEEDRNARGDIVGGRDTDASVPDGRRRLNEFKHDDRVAEDERPAVEEGAAAARRAEAWEGAAYKAISQASEEDAMIKELKARKEAAMARAKAAAEGLPMPGGDDALEEAKKEAKRARKEAKKAKKESKKERKNERKSSFKKGGSHGEEEEDDGLGSSSEEQDAVPAKPAEQDRNCGSTDGGHRQRSHSRDGGSRRRRCSRDRFEDGSRRGGRDRSRDRDDDRGDRRDDRR